MSIIIVSDSRQCARMRLALNGSEFVEVHDDSAAAAAEHVNGDGTGRANGHGNGHANGHGHSTVHCDAISASAHLLASGGRWFLEGANADDDGSGADSAGRLVPPSSRPSQPAPAGTQRPEPTPFAEQVMIEPVRRRTYMKVKVASFAPPEDRALARTARHDAPLAAPPAPIPPPAAEAAVSMLRRWLPVLVMGVLLLVLAAHAALSARSARETGLLRAEMFERLGDGRSDAALLDAVREEIRTRSQADRVAILQELSTAIHSQGEQQANQTADRLLERLAPPAASRAPGDSTQPSQPPSTDPVSLAMAAATEAAPAKAAQAEAHLPAPSIVFLVDASSPALAESMPRVYAELSREVNRLGAGEDTRLLLLEGGRLVEASAKVLPSLKDIPSKWGEFLKSKASSPELVLDRGACTPADAIRRGLRYAPSQLFVLCETLGGGGDDGGGDGSDTGGTDVRGLRRALLELNSGAVTRVHVIHFFRRAARGDLIALAQEQRGSYSFIPAAAADP